MILQPIDATGIAESLELRASDVPAYPQSPEDMKILAIVLQDTQLAEQRDREWCKFSSWDDNDNIYLFRVPQQRWEGTQVPRSSLGVPLVLEHINAINNQIGEILWEEDPPFAVDGYGSYENQTMEQRANTEVLRFLLNASEAEDEIKRLSHSGLLHGTGAAKAYWEEKDGYMCPVIEYIERRHVKVASNLRVPDIRKAAFVAHETYKTPEQIDMWRNLTGFKNIPSLPMLKQLGVHPKETASRSIGDLRDSTFSSMNLQSEFEPPDPTRPFSADPSHHPLKVTEYMNRNWVWTVLSDKLVIRVAPRTAVKYFSSYLIPVDGQFDGIGLGILLGNEQRLQQGLINTSLDNLALSLLGMFKRRKGASMFPNQIHVRPGVVFDVDKMEDLEPVQFTPIDPKMFDHLQMSDHRAQRRSGANEVTVQGSIPSGGSGGFGRTAEGMSQLGEGSSARIRTYVKVIENQVIIPFLEFLVETAPQYMSKKQIKEIIGKELADAWNPTAFSKMKFKMLAPTKMKRRAAMIQAIPQLISFYQQDPVQQALKGQYQSLDFNELNWLWFDATGYPIKGNLVKDMSSDEIDAMMSENELVQQLIIQKAQMQMQTDSSIQIADAENAGRAFRDVLKAALDQQKIDQATYDQMMQMMGGMAASDQMNQQAATAQQQLAPVGAMNGQQTNGNPGAGPGTGITPYSSGMASGTGNPRPVGKGGK